MTIYKWSDTASGNQTADSNCPWPEGQAPSTVNDSARGMMAVISKWRADLCGLASLPASTSSLYVVNTNVGYDTLANMNLGQFTFIPLITNFANCQINVDGLGPKFLRGQNGVALPAGTLIPFTGYSIRFNNSSGEWLIDNYYLSAADLSAYVVPIGTVLDYAGATPPNANFQLCYGQLLSKATYSALNAIFLAAGYPFGDAGVNFALPDLRGRVAAGKDNMGGTAANRLTVGPGNDVAGTILGTSGGAQSFALLAANIPAHSHNLTYNTGDIADTGSGATVVTAIASTGLAVPITTANSSGVGQEHSSTQPTMIFNKIIRVI